MNQDHSLAITLTQITSLVFNLNKKNFPLNSREISEVSFFFISFLFSLLKMLFLLLGHSRLVSSMHKATIANQFQFFRLTWRNCSDFQYGRHLFPVLSLFFFSNFFFEKFQKCGRKLIEKKLNYGNFSFLALQTVWIRSRKTSTALFVFVHRF